jgi:hypothetical protein
VSKELSFEEISIKSKKIKGLSVVLEWDCGEGICGDYNEEDPNDVPLLRFDVMFKGEQADNGSYCTQLQVTDKRPLLKKAVKLILNVAEKYFGDEGSLSGFKRSMEELSWMEIKDGKLNSPYRS